MTDEEALKVTRIVHSSILIEFNGSSVLTDPWFSEKFGYHHGEPLACPVEDLRPLAGVAVSHDHFDHNDMDAFARYRDKRVPIVAERSAIRKAQRAGFTNVSALEPWESAHLGPVKVTAVPARHGVPEIGFVFEASGFTVYFGGDTLWIPELAEVPRRFPPIDIALVPINGLKVFGKQVVMNPIEAAELCAAFQPRVAIPIHYAFQGGPIPDTLFLKYFDRQERLPQIFKEAVEKRAPETRVTILEPGMPMKLSRQPAEQHR